MQLGILQLACNMEGPKSLPNSGSLPDRRLDVLDDTDSAALVGSIVISVAEQVLVWCDLSVD